MEEVPRRAIWVSCWHLIVIALSGLVLWYFNGVYEVKGGYKIALYSISFGALGGTLVSSRYVIYAVRHESYDPKRVLWQTLTPIHSAVFASVAVVLVQGSILSLYASVPDYGSDRFMFFVMGFSFVVGFASEIFVKRLIDAAESFLGEEGGIQDVTREDLPYRSMTTPDSIVYDDE
jgi:hypothetical protein